MSGHSKWSTIKRKKEANDNKRGKIFTKLVKEITTAARMGGGDADANPRLRAAIVTAKSSGMPADNIARAIKKGTGELEGAQVEELSFEGYGAGGVAFFIETQTDNRNRTTAEIRHAFSKNNGNMGNSGSVGWMFHRHGQFAFDAERYNEDDIMEIALEAGADDVSIEDDTIIVLCDMKDFATVLEYFDKNKVEYQSAELTMIPENQIDIAGKTIEQVLRLMEHLEDLDDVMKVYANFDMNSEDMEKITNG